MKNGLTVFGNMDDMRTAMVAASKMSNSDLLPASYKGKPENVLIALDMARRMNMPAMMIMQNLETIHGNPSWKSTFLLGLMNGSGKFVGGVRFETKDIGEKNVEYTEWVGPKNARSAVKKTSKIHDVKCRAWAMIDGEKVFGAWVSIGMAVKEGWYFRNGSKWQSMPEQMLMYRAAAFFSKIYASELTLGLGTVDESADRKFDETVDADYEIQPDPIATINKAIRPEPEPTPEPDPEPEPENGDWI